MEEPEDAVASGRTGSVESRVLTHFAYATISYVVRGILHLVEFCIALVFWRHLHLHYYLTP